MPILVAVPGFKQIMAGFHDFPDMHRRFLGRLDHLQVGNAHGQKLIAGIADHLAEHVIHIDDPRIPGVYHPVAVARRLDDLAVFEFALPATGNIPANGQNEGLPSVFDAPGKQLDGDQGTVPMHVNRLETARSFFYYPFQTASNLARQFRWVELFRAHAQQFFPAVPHIIAGRLVELDQVAFEIGYKDGVACMVIQHAIHIRRKLPSLTVSHIFLQYLSQETSS
ncbi:MAG: hypothetical protein K8F26_08595 [Thiobacillus sp.]|nr:hypothetical protein [Thiobacillus sp.]